MDTGAGCLSLSLCLLLSLLQQANERVNRKIVKKKRKSVLLQQKRAHSVANGSASAGVLVVLLVPLALVQAGGEMSEEALAFTRVVVK